MAPHSSTLAWKIPWTEEPGKLQSVGSLGHFSLSCIGEGNGNPLQCSCLENPRDGGAWWAAVYGVAQGRTRLKRLSSSSSSSRGAKRLHCDCTAMSPSRARQHVNCTLQELHPSLPAALPVPARRELRSRRQEVTGGCVWR